MSSDSVYSGVTGPAGPQGIQGIQGIQGLTGPGVPAGGTTGQILEKINGTDYNTQWVDPPVFGTRYQNVTSIVISTTTSGSFQQKLRLTTPSLPAGNYIVFWSSTMGGQDSDKKYGARFQQNDSVTLGEWDMKPKEGAGLDGPNSSFAGHRVLSLTGVNTFDIDFRAAGEVARIQDASISIWRVS